ncbi:MAG: DNA alkylation repair protein [Phycisphaerae bacterium]|nr:DNA alkylation repair protein [Saprospiraceae bacterium]
MAEPLKNIFSRTLLEPFTAELRYVWEAFPTEDFLHQVFNDEWEARELKQRIRHISHALRMHLPQDYPVALDIVTKTTERYLDRHGDNLSFHYIFLPDFIEAWGLEHPEESIAAIETITRWSSAEFTVRPFLRRYPERMYAQMLHWSQHPSAMVRRLSSEGIRPRLPWGMGVPALKLDPSPILPILENLKNDAAETVRRSVANNLNDIAKDHPELVLSMAERWLGQSLETDWIVRHACRGLLKKGNAAALAHFGFQKGLQGIEISDFKIADKVSIGWRLDFSFSVKNTAAQFAQIRLEYGIDYQTLSGKTSSKVFKIKELVVDGGQSVNIMRHQSFQDFTTRKHYVGKHKLRILMNGAELAQAEFEVIE